MAKPQGKMQQQEARDDGMIEKMNLRESCHQSGQGWSHHGFRSADGSWRW